MSATRRADARQIRLVKGLLRRARARRLADLRLAPVGRYEEDEESFVIMPAEEITIRDGHGRLVLSEKGTDFAVPLKEHADALTSRPLPLGKCLLGKLGGRK